MFILFISGRRGLVVLLFFFLLFLLWCLCDDALLFFRLAILKQFVQKTWNSWWKLRKKKQGTNINDVPGSGWEQKKIEQIFLADHNHRKGQVKVKESGCPVGCTRRWHRTAPNRVTWQKAGKINPKPNVTHARTHAPTIRTQLEWGEFSRTLNRALYRTGNKDRLEVRERKATAQCYQVRDRLGLTGSKPTVRWVWRVL